jgi:hypothetical protein
LSHRIPDSRGHFIHPALIMCWLPLLQSPSSHPPPSRRWWRTPDVRAATHLDDGCSALPRWLPVAAAAGQGGSVCAGWCPPPARFLRFPQVTVYSSDLLHHLWSSTSPSKVPVHGLGEIPAQRWPALSTVMPESAVTFLEALA